MTPQPEPLPYEAQVLAYLADCRQAKTLLDGRWHPTGDGAVKVIWHNGDKAEARKIRETFAALSGVTDLAARRAAKAGRAA